ncbi:MAG: peptidoglycan DD-metalloendopeptidase family protein [Cyclobacteriaceae bacterium]|nr:peptidoglycan DD-metalloendopeptidase family protein [Cyclobacteriaceae bacterium]
MKSKVTGGFFLVVLLTAAIVFYLVQKTPAPASIGRSADTVRVIAADTMPAAPPKIIYGINIDSLDVIENVIRPNQFLGEILSKHNVSDREIHELSQKSREVHDVRKLVSRKKYTLLCSRDSIQKVQYMIYEPSNTEYVIYKIKDSIEVLRQVRKIDTIRSQAAGIIESSLWETMTNAGTDPLLIHALSEVFAWQVDFYRVQKGDKFKVIYEKLLVEDQPVGIGKIIGAYFNHFGNDYYAIYFDQGNGISYFDEKGQSLQKQFLRAPLKYNRISSRYTRRRFHPVLKRYKAHLGTDYAAPTGTPIRSVGDGIVEEARYAKYNGRYVKVRHNSVYTTQYLHMSGFASGIRKGARIKQGQVIGYVGSTGLANGPHLCFRFWKNGQQVDALKVELPPSEPVTEKYKAAYEVIKEAIISNLNKIDYSTGEEETLATSKQL